MEIRPEREQDQAAVYRLNSAAFATDAEARLVDSLRKLASPIVSLVAIVNNRVTGHILFSPVQHSENKDALVMGLAPMAVAEAARNQGIGSALVAAGIAACARLGAGAIVVLGHPGYYPRFGFTPASDYGLECEYDVPDEAFMAMELTPQFLASKPGTIKYHECFADL
jgi:putative acetyltransferase